MMVNAQLLAPVADTFLWKESRNVPGLGKTMLLRDNRFSQGLIKFDVSGLTTPATAAAFRFKLLSVERAGNNANFACHRMLVDWSEQATWFQAAPDIAAPWNGLKAGVHFEVQPFATAALAAVKKGDLVELRGFEKAVEAWRTGRWPNHGFLLTLSGKALQVTFASREAAPAGVEKEAKLGEAVLRFDPALLRQILPRGDEFTAAALRVRVADWKKGPPTAKFTVAVCGHGEIASALLANVATNGWLEIPGVAAAVRAGSLTLAVTNSPTPIRITGNAAASLAPQLALTLPAAIRPQLFENPLRPVPGVYTSVADGHLVYGGQRLRLWGAVGTAGFDRVRKMGFNAWRMWGPTWNKVYSVESLRTGEFAATDVLDELDQHYAACRAQGLFVMATQLAGFAMPVEMLATNGSFVAGGDDWPEWQAALLKAKTEAARFVFFDERLQRAKKKHAENFLNHRNPHTGRRYAEAECIAICELNNENGFVPALLDGKFASWPDYFQQKLKRRWNDWLRQRYPAETFGNVELGATGARTNDFVRFAIELAENWNNELRAHCRQQGRPGVGVAVAPFSFDTQYRGSLPWQYSVAHAADVASFGMYFWNMQSLVARPPSLYVLDSHTVAGKPTVIYETNAGRPDPFRSEYPLMLAAFASWQDWDAIFFHYWAGAPDGVPDEQYLLLPLPAPTLTHYWSAVQHHSDPVMCAALAMAGRLFLHGSLQRAPAPAIFEAGRDAIFSRRFQNGVGLRETAFTRGSALRFAPEKTTSTLPAPSDPATNAVASGDEILWDWPHGRLIIDAPAVKAYVGKTAGAYRFQDGTALTGVSTPWVCWVLTSADGQPLATARKLNVIAVADAQNTGFAMDLTRDLSGPINQAKAIMDRGHLPVVQDPVAFTVHFSTQLDAVFHAYDFALREFSQQKLVQTNQLIVAGAPLFVGVLDVAQRGAAVNTPASTPVRVTVMMATPVAAAPLLGVWCPLRGVIWGCGPESIKVLGPASTRANVIQLMESKFAWNSAADVQLTFGATGLHRIEAVFKQPPTLAVAAADYEQQFGKPHTQTLASQEQVSTIAWRVRQPGATLDITLTETQGTLRAIYEVQR